VRTPTTSVDLHVFGACHDGVLWRVGVARDFAITIAAACSCWEFANSLEVVLPRVEWTPALTIAWWEHQQRRKRVAQLCHWARWLREHPSAL
jgi:hypothetical protein